MMIRRAKTKWFQTENGKNIHAHLGCHSFRALSRLRHPIHRSTYPENDPKFAGTIQLHLSGLVWFGLLFMTAAVKLQEQWQSTATPFRSDTEWRKKKRSCVGRKHKNAIAFSSRWLLTANEIPIASWITPRWRRKERRTQCIHTQLEILLRYCFPRY